MDKFLMVTNFFIGTAVFAYSMKIASSLGKCTENSLKNSLYGLIITSLILIVSSVSFVICNMSCDCSMVKPFSKTVYIVYFVLLGIVITTLSAIIFANAKKHKDCEKLKGESNIILIMGILVILTSIVFGAVEYRHKIAGVTKRGISAFKNRRS